MKIVVTGAGGFVGSALANKLKSDKAFKELLLVDRVFPEGVQYSEEDGIVTLKGDIHDPVVIEQIFASNVDTFYHLAALPGGAAEADPDLSKKINLDATLALFEAAAKANCRRVVYSSSIAVLDPSQISGEVDDTAPLSPTITYGYHKAMVELALADLARRKVIEIVGLRLPGILARPAAPSGLKSAFLSDVFHKLKAHQPFESPVSLNATFWLLSVERCIENLLHAAYADTSLFPSSSVMTLPAIHCSMEALVETIIAQTGASESLISYKPDDDLEKVFGSYPPLKTPSAEHAGLKADASLEQLVKTVLANI
jgi:nucleoside-diphosphate-sugar epimerase